MTGKLYYVTTLGDWKRRLGSYVNSHWFALASVQSAGEEIESQPGPGSGELNVHDSAQIIVVIEADEGSHAFLEDDASFEQLPHPMSTKHVSSSATAAMMVLGVHPGSPVFEAVEVAGGFHPLLRHRVF
jgi:hypothetical protein